jgi:hypothetical protein
MVNKRSMGGMVAALSFFLVFPALASAHLLAVSAGQSHCVTPLTGQYTATVTVTETYFGGTTESIPVGQNVYELASSTDKGNTGKNQNYFTQGTVGAQTGPENLGQPTSFTSPASGGAATQQFTVTTSVPETYVLGNSYMGTPSSATVTAASANLPDRGHAHERQVRAADELPERRDADRRRLRAPDELPEWPDPHRRQVRASDELPDRADGRQRPVCAADELSEWVHLVGRPVRAADELSERVHLVERPVRASDYLPEWIHAVGRPMSASHQLPERGHADERPVRASHHLPRRGHGDRQRLHAADDRASADRLPGRLPGFDSGLQGPGGSAGHDHRLGQPSGTGGGGRQRAHHPSRWQGRDEEHQ